MAKYSQKLLDHAKQSDTDAFKTATKIAVQKTAEATGDSLVTKLLVELQMFQKINNKKIQRQIQMSMIKKYLKKDIQDVSQKRPPKLSGPISQNNNHFKNCFFVISNLGHEHFSQRVIKFSSPIQ